MKNLQVIMLLVITFVIGLHFTSIVNYIKTSVHHANTVQYCNDIYMGNDYKINACINRLK